MLFSDIEASTRLLSRLGDRYGEALSAQRALVRAAISSFRGQEIGTEGDSFFVVFGSAADAIAAELGDCAQAARLAGAAQSVRQEAGMPASPPDAATLEHFLAPARAAAAPGEWDAALAAGRALTREQAITLLAPA
jgi:hypothetical protein